MYIIRLADKTEVILGTPIQIKLWLRMGSEWLVSKLYSLRVVVWITRRKEIQLAGGFREALLILPFLKQFKADHPTTDLVLYYKDSDRQVNEVKDYLSNIPFIDALHPFSLVPKGERWDASRVARRNGGLVSPRHYQSILDECFVKDDYTLAEKIWRKFGLSQKFVIVMHFDACSELIESLYSLIQSCASMKDEAVIIAITDNASIEVDLSRPNTYVVKEKFLEKFGFRSILAMGQRADLFIGGRTGLECFFWLARTPSINFFDNEGFEEIRKGYWSVSFWEENPIVDGLVDMDTANIDELLSGMIIPRFRDWQQLHLLNDHAKTFSSP
ncbi:hypothetical protein HOH87_04205 [bacterium]|nr:hypothetical protein [bacterium]